MALPIRGNSREMGWRGLNGGETDSSAAKVNVCQRHKRWPALRVAGGRWSTFITWAKNTFSQGRADYQRQYEPYPV
jgi:hypothetical protein